MKTNKFMNKEKLLLWLKLRIPSMWWNSFWWLLPLSGILLLPVSTIFFSVLYRFIFLGANLLQLNILFSIFYGILVGLFVLFMVDDVNLDTKIVGIIKWLAVGSMLSPITFFICLSWFINNVLHF